SPARPGAATGRLVLVVPPLAPPRMAPAPQHTTLPPAIAHVRSPAAAIAVTLEVRPMTRTGTSRTSVVPSPSWPCPLSPQHATPPSPMSAQLWFLPAATAVTPLVRPVTSTGVALPTCVPSPNTPIAAQPQ